MQVAGRIVAAFSQPLVLDEATVDVSVSLGIACAARHGRDDDDLLSRADEAMYAAKDRGGATFRMADRAANTSKGPGQAIGALRPVRRAASARGG